MRITRQQLNFIISESLSNSTDGSGPLGSYVFPNDRYDLDRSASAEPDTDLEKSLFHAIRLHFSSGMFRMPNAAILKIVELIKKNSYPNIFQRYEGGNVYRGMILTKIDYENMFGISVPERVGFFQNPLGYLKRQRVTQIGSIKKSFRYTPGTHPEYVGVSDAGSQENYMLGHASSESSSWSKSYSDALILPQLSVANLNYTDILEKEYVIVVLEAPSSGNNFFIDVEPWAKRFKFLRDNEYKVPIVNELIGVKSIFVKKIYTFDVTA